MLEKLKSGRGVLQASGVAVLLLILGVQIFFSVRRQSQTWDEGDHIFAGYMSLKNADFGLNPEHPPLVKMLAAAPLLSMPLIVPELQNRNFKHEAFLDGKDFLYRNDADEILFRTRLTAAILTFLTALLVFAGTKEMFGIEAAFIALALLVFNPNFIAHGAYVTTDAGVSCLMFATIYAFYRYVKTPSPQRLALVGITLGLAFAVKHSAIFLVPMLLVLAICEIVSRFFAERNSEAVKKLLTNTLKFAASLAVIGVIAVVILWAFYGFRFQARPQGLALNPSLAEYTQNLKPREARLISTIAQMRLLPESYLYGMTDILLTSYPSFVLEKTYPLSVWFYFPIVFLIKSTVAFLIFFLMILAAIVTRRLSCWREILFLSVPPLLYFAVAMISGTNIGVRHILPIYVFLSALAGGAAWAFAKRSRKWSYAVAALLLFNAASTALAFPYYIPYANELWGGSANAYKLLSDSNADWGEQLKETKKYLDGREVKDCWFVYFAEGVAEPGYYGVPCKPLPTVNTLWLNQKIEVPASVDGTVLISASNLSGFEFGPGALNPYEQFKHISPTARIGYGVFVFDGHFDLPLASALGHIQNAQNALAAKQTDAALSEARTAATLAPEFVAARMTLGDALKAAGQTEEARAEYEKALQLAKTIEPEFQARVVPEIEKNLSGE